ncbi:MAG: T9SS type A sorting domain-containing protein, partial [Bacteroidetes bacterium]|nr:T9SS type A sorting domain-containing protein [Bacteroidota bacterium]
GALSVTSLINGCSANAAYSTIGASPDQSAGTCAPNGPNYNRWFKFKASATTYIDIQLKTGGAFGNMQYSWVTLWDSLGTQLSCSPYNSLNQGTMETSYLGLTPGNYYYISVDNYTGVGYRGTFSLCLSDKVDYNYKSGALSVTSLINGCSANAAYSTIGASPDQSAGTCAPNGPNYNRWFKFKASATTYIDIQLKTGGAFGNMQYSWVTLWDSLGTQLSCSPYNSLNQGTMETDYFGLTPGNYYYISVDNYTGVGYRGTFSLCLSDVPGYNYYQGALALTDPNNWCSSNAVYSTIGASPDKAKGSCWAGPGPNNNVWFKFTAITPNATIQLKTGGAFGTLQYPLMALWQSNGTTQIACSTYSGQYAVPSITVASLTVGNTYYISIDNFVGLGYRGTFSLCFTNVSATVFYSRQNGDWNTVGTWSNAGYGGVSSGTVPAAGNVVNIRDNNITVTSAAQGAQVNLSTSAGNTSLTITNATLTVNGQFVTTNSTNNSNTTTVQTNGTLAVANNFSATTSGGTAGVQVNVPTGTISVGQDMNWSSSGGTVTANTLAVSNSSNVNVARDINFNYSGGMKLSLNFNNSANLSVGRDMSYTSSAAAQTEAIFNGSATMGIARNIVRGGTPYGNLTFNNSSVLTFNGTGYQQTIPGSAGSGGDAIYFNNVVFNNTSGFPYPFLMGGVATINNAMTLTKGVIQSTASNYIALLNGSTTTIGSTNCYIDGPMTYEVATSTANTVRNFPIGNNGAYRPAILTVTHTSASSVIYTAQHFSVSAVTLGYTLSPTIERVSGARYWNISSSDQSNLSSASVTLYYGYGTTDGVTDLPHLTVVKNVGIGTTWVDIGKVSDTAEPGYIVSGPFSSFSNFTLANLYGGTNPLPIQLTSFTGNFSDGVVYLKWTTASELNNDYFTVEKSQDAKNFVEVAKVQGAGTKNTPSDYEALDNLPFNGLTYYRLRQTDFDGKSTASEIISVYADVASSIVAYPNPTHGEPIKLKTSVAVSPDASVELVDLFGKILYSDKWSSLPVSNGVSFIQTQGLASGVYIVRIRSHAKTVTVKVIISD